MKKHMLVSSFAAFLLNLRIFIFLVFLKSPFCLASSSSYEDCAPRNCGDGNNVSFPFYIGGLQPSDCGYPGFKLDCNNGSLIIQISGNNYLIKFMFTIAEATTSGAMVLVNSPITTCPSAITNLTLDDNTFSVDSSKELVILKNCSISQLPKNLTRYRIDSCDQLVMSRKDMNLGIGMEVCTQVVRVPIQLQYVDTVVDGGNYEEVMNSGFVMSWRAPDCGTCSPSGGRCVYIAQEDQLHCLCPNSSDAHPSEDCQAAQSRLVGGKIERFCKCDRQLRVQTSTTRTNPGKRFVKCAQCRVYEFLDVDLPSEYYKDLVYGFFQRQRGVENAPMIEALALDKARLEEELKATKTRLEEEVKAGKSKLELYDRLFMMMLGVLCFICVWFGMKLSN